MEVKRTYTYRLEPSANQRDALNRLAGCARFVWNQAVESTRNARQAGESVPGYGGLCERLRGWKHACPWLVTDGHSQVLQQKLRDLSHSWARFFDRNCPNAGLPRFKRRGDGDSIRFPQGVAVYGHHIKLPKLASVRFRKSRDLPDGAEVRSVVVTRDGRHWFAHLQCAVRLSDPGYAEGTDLLGLDLGVTRFLTASDGTIFLAQTARYQRLQRRLVHEQRRLARKRRASTNRARQRKRVAALHRKLRNIRHDFCHQVSTALAKSHGWIAVENLAVGSMTASARGTAENPGQGVAQKAGLNRSILEQGWSRFVAMLDYKLEARGGMLTRVHPAHTSQQCPKCGHTEEGNRPRQATFQCLGCGHTDHADRVGAVNVRARGIGAVAVA